MRIKSVFLAEAANVREGTLGVLSGFLNHFARSEFPATLGCVLVAVMSADPLLDALPREIQFRLTYGLKEEEAETVFMEGSISVQAGGDRVAYLPIIFGLADAPLPAAGHYELILEIAGMVERLDFYADDLTV